MGLHRPSRGDPSSGPWQAWVARRPRLGGKVSGLRCRDRVWTEAGLQLLGEGVAGSCLLCRGWCGATPEVCTRVQTDTSDLGFWRQAAGS